MNKCFFQDYLILIINLSFINPFLNSFCFCEMPFGLALVNDTESQYTTCSDNETYSQFIPGGNDD